MKFFTLEMNDMTAWSVNISSLKKARETGNAEKFSRAMQSVSRQISRMDAEDQAEAIDALNWWLAN